MSNATTKLLILLLIACSWLSAEDFKTWKEAQKREYENSRHDAEKYWRELKASSDRVWVTYGREGASRTVIDHAKGRVNVAVVLEPSEERHADKVLREAVDELLEQRESDGTPLLAGLLVIGDKTFDGSKHGLDLESAIAHRDTSTVVGKDGRKRTVLSLELRMASDRLNANADHYRRLIEPLVADTCLPVSLVLALAQRESLFNPRAHNAKSGAIGLLQIKPSAAGRFMNKRMNGRDAEPSVEELQDPVGNLRYGIGYLLYLYNEEFDEIENRETRLLCVIAGYRFGWGNVKKACGKYPGEAAHWSPEKMDRALRRTFCEPMQLKYFDDLNQLIQNYGGY
jgi:membrane-bound lytic murein transglycosylase C